MSREAQIELLLKSASLMARDKSPTAKKILLSYYLMRCREVTKGYGLPDRFFSTKLRCSHCYSEWDNNSQIKVQAIKLSKKQKLRIKRCKKSNNNKESALLQKNLLRSNEIIQVCSFCEKATTTPVLKPQKLKISCSSTENKCEVKKRGSKTQNIPVTEISKQIIKKIDHTNQQQTKSNNELGIYSMAKDVFSLANKNNTLQSNEKKSKVIKNNKRKKDKFAGLCQQAVLASAKLKKGKMEIEKQNKLNLFLKPL